jgi:hypothetical protein
MGEEGRLAKGKGEERPSVGGGGRGGGQEGAKVGKGHH